MSTAEGEVTLLLRAMKSGDETAAERLLPLVYSELHRLARSYMRRERRDHTLQPTALINEAYLRLAHDDIDWQNRQHFIAVAATVMRRFLVDYARGHDAEMRGGDFQRVQLSEVLVMAPERSEEVLAVNEALDALQAINPRQAQVVELRYFAGLSIDEVASTLNISPRSVKRDWMQARRWLYREVQKGGTARSTPRAGQS